MKKWISFYFVIGLGASASAMSLDEFLGQVQSRHSTIKSLGEMQNSAAAKRRAGDVGLTPVVTLSAQNLDDKKQTSLGSTTFLDSTKSTQYSLGLAKKFSTGTTAQVQATTGEQTVAYTNNGVAAGQATFGASSLGISLSQSLWKDFFGSATRLRQDRELEIEKAERASYDLQARQLLIEAEAAFWEHLYLRNELKQRQSSLERAQRIESWVQRRVQNGIGDEADLFNAKGLVAARKLQLLGTTDELQASEQKIRDLLELASSEKLAELQAPLDQVRDLEKLNAQASGGEKGKRIRLDSYLAAVEARTKTLVSREVEDAYRPDLSLEAQYKTNALESSMSAATSKITDQNRPTSAVGLKFTWMFEGEAKSSARESARSEALAARLKRDRKLLESESSWNELKRRHLEMSKKVEAAKIANEIQSKKASFERDKLSKGRSVTSQVITAEQDAAEAELTLIRLFAEQRKIEAQTRLYIQVQEENL